MCGISGAFSIKSKINTLQYYDSHSSLKHRGPDDEGFFCHDEGLSHFAKGDDTIEEISFLPNIKSLGNQKFIMGHRRLSIIDLTSAGHQPMDFDDLVIVFNGEIYNYLEIKRELISKGYTFHSQTDTEVFLKAFHLWGTKCFERLNGMWAAAIYNKRNRKIILTRDRFGIKPLYYLKNQESFHFSSEIKFFKNFTRFSVNEEIASEYLNNSWIDHRSQTMINQIQQVLPGNYIEYFLEKNTINTVKYWSIDNVKNIEIDLETAKEQFNYLFSSSVDLRMRSDVPVGALLSGGLDSNAIVCNLGYRNKILKNSFYTYSAIFDDEKFSEKKFIKDTVKKVESINQNWITYKPEDVVNEIEHLHKIQENPIRSLSVFSQMKIYERIKNHNKVTVLLNGQGADEIFAGYTNHRIPRIASGLINLDLKDFYTELKSHKKITDKSYLNIAKEVTKCIYGHKLVNKNNIYKIDQFNVSEKDPLLYNLKSNLLFASLPEYLRYEDRNSMAFSKEARLPFLDYRLVEWGFGIANNLKINHGISKYVMRKSISNYTTKSVVESKKKMGFISPQENWQKNKLYQWLNERSEVPSFFKDNKKIKNLENDSWLKWRLASFNEWKNSFGK